MAEQVPPKPEVSNDDFIILRGDDQRVLPVNNGLLQLYDRSNARIGRCTPCSELETDASLTQAYDSSHLEVELNEGVIEMEDNSHVLVSSNQGPLILKGSSSAHVEQNPTFSYDSSGRINLGFSVGHHARIDLASAASLFINQNRDFGIDDIGGLTLVFMPPAGPESVILTKNTRYLLSPAVAAVLNTPSPNHQVFETQGRRFAVIEAQGIHPYPRAFAVFEEREVQEGDKREKRFIFIDGRDVKEEERLMERLKEKTGITDLSVFAKAFKSLANNNNPLNFKQQVF